MSDIKLNLKPVGQHLQNQLKSLVPVRTGRLRDSISYIIREEHDGYVISFQMEDYFAWLKPRKAPPTLPTRKELMMARPPLPKMNTLKSVKDSDLSPRAQKIMKSVDIKTAIDQIDKKELEEKIKEIIEL